MVACGLDPGKGVDEKQHSARSIDFSVHNSSISLHFHTMSARARSFVGALFELTSSTAEDLVRNLSQDDLAATVLHLVHDKVHPTMQPTSVFAEGTLFLLNVLKDNQPCEKGIQS